MNRRYDRAEFSALPFENVMKAVFFGFGTARVKIN